MVPTTMSSYDLVIAGLIATILINIPFGYLRAKFKEQGSKIKWFLAIHAPIPFIAVMRREIGVGWYLIPLFIIAFSIGQYVGGLMYKKGYFKSYNIRLKILSKIE